MDTVLIIVGLIALITGFLLLIAPKVLIKIGETLNRILAIDDVIFSQRLIFGILLIVAGIYMIYTFVNLPK